MFFSLTNKYFWTISEPVEEPPNKQSKVEKKSKDKPEKKVKDTKKKSKVEEEDDEEVIETDDTVKKKSGRKPKAEKTTEKKEKPPKEDKKSEKAKKEKTDDKAPKGKPSRKAKQVENGKSEEEKEKVEKTLINPSDTKWNKIDFTCSKQNANGQLPNLKISCWNVGGLKSWIKKDCVEFLSYEDPDIFCLQETRCSEEKLPEEIKLLTNYKQYWCSSDKEGYAGVGFFTKIEPLEVIYGINVPEQDEDGRCITAEYNKYYVVCVYVPNAGKIAL